MTLPLLLLLLLLWWLFHAVQRCFCRCGRTARLCVAAHTIACQSWQRQKRGLIVCRGSTDVFEDVCVNWRRGGETLACATLAFRRTTRRATTRSGRGRRAFEIRHWKREAPEASFFVFAASPPLRRLREQPSSLSSSPLPLTAGLSALLASRWRVQRCLSDGEGSAL